MCGSLLTHKAKHKINGPVDFVFVILNEVKNLTPQNEVIRFLEFIYSYSSSWNL